MRMQAKWRWSSLVVLAILMMTGCGKNREAQLVGEVESRYQQHDAARHQCQRCAGQSDGRDDERHDEQCVH